MLALSAALGLSAPPLGAAMRVLWASLTTPGTQRSRAFSLDAVAEELLFVAGPVVITAVIVASSPAVGLVVTAAAVFLGTLGMTTSAVSASQRGSRAQTLREHRPLAQPGFARTLVALLGVGAVLGTVEIAAPALATNQGALELSGWLLAAFAGGSAIGGLVYGQREHSSSLGVRLVVLSVGMGLAALIASQVTAIPVFAVLLVAIGAFLAPSLITGYLMADALVPEGSRTEASTWINTAVNLGAALASAGAGVVIDEVGAGLALAGCGGLAVVLAAAAPFRRGVSTA